MEEKLNKKKLLENLFQNDTRFHERFVEDFTAEDYAEFVKICPEFIEERKENN